LLQRPRDPDLGGRRAVSARDGEYLVVVGAGCAGLASFADDRAPGAAIWEVPAGLDWIAET
jgi:hypothetical protein